MVRTKADLGAGLAQPRPGRALPRDGVLHVVGIGGMAGLGAALHARALGLVVSGCDQHVDPWLLELLRREGIQAVEGAAHDLPVDTTIVAASKAVTSVAPEHRDLAAARARGLEPWAVQQVIADAAAARGAPLIGVAGTHGKTTTTAWVLELLRASNRDPSAFVGGPLPEGIGTPPRSPVHVGADAGFVLEADEYGGNFDAYVADAALLLNAEWDHPDVFEDRAAVVDAFVEWLRPVLVRGPVVINIGDAGGHDVARALRAVANDEERKRIITFAVESSGEAPTVTAAVASEALGAQSLHALSVAPGYAVELAALGGLAGERLSLGLSGAHNAANALGAAVLAAAMGASEAGLRTGLARFPGVGRRMEVLLDQPGLTVIDDYGHHPTAIAATVATVRARYPGRPLWLAIEPLTYHRTAALLGPLASASAAADQVFVVEIHASRDPDTSIASAEGLATAIRHHGGSAQTVGKATAAAAHLVESLPDRAVLLVMGGGRSTDIAHRVAEQYRGR